MKGKTKTRNIGVDLEAPKDTCNDKNCPYHGGLKVRGRTFTGTITGLDLNRTAKIEWKRSQYIPKYERYEIRKSSVKAHSPDCISAKKGDIVTIMECRPISKTKSFVIIHKETKQ